jgi:hypothetical protein
MERNFNFIDLGDDNLSHRLADFLETEVDWEQYTPEHHKDSIYAISNWLPKEAVEPCQGLIDAVNRVCSWDDVDHVMVFRFSPGVEVIHRDEDCAYLPDRTVPVKWHLNIPVTNCENTYTAIYEALPDQHQHYTLEPDLPGLAFESGDDGNTHVYRSDQVKEIDRYYFRRPVVLNTKTIHCVHNPTDQVSVRLSLRMNCDVLEKYVNP